MSAPFIVLVQHGSRGLAFVEPYGPFDEDEADALAARLRRDYGLKTEAVRLRPWSDDTVRRSPAIRDTA